MIHDQHQLELIRSHVDGTASDDQTKELEAALRTDAGFRRLFLRYVNADSALASGRLSQAPELPQQHNSPTPKGHTNWTFWRPLTAAAAGVVLGLFCAGAAWAVVRPWQAGPRVNAVLLDESFEKHEERLPEGFPTGAGVWGGERTALVNGDERVEPFHGDHMVRLEPSATTPLSYLSQIIDLRSMPRAEVGEVRQIEVTASFHADSPGFRERYTLRVATFGEEPGSIQAQWIDVPWQAVSGRSLSHCKSGLSTQAEDGGWQTLTALVEAPPEAASVVVSLAAGRLDAAAPKTPHYIDDVRARLVISPRALKPRKNRK